MSRCSKHSAFIGLDALYFDLCASGEHESKHSFPTMYGQVPKTCWQSDWPGAAAEGSIPRSRSFSLSKKSNNLLLFLEIQERNLLGNRHDTDNFQLSCQSHFQVIFKSVRAEDKIGLPHFLIWVISRIVVGLYHGEEWLDSFDCSQWKLCTIREDVKLCSHGVLPVV